MGWEAAKIEVEWKRHSACVSFLHPDEAWRSAAFIDFCWFRRYAYITEMGESVVGALELVFRKVLQICREKGIKQLYIAALVAPHSKEEKLALSLRFKPALRPLPLSIRREIQATRFTVPYSVLVYEIGGQKNDCSFD